jgi:chloramphenicol 3-O phosphotransferase
MAARREKAYLPFVQTGDSPQLASDRSVPGQIVILNGTPRAGKSSIAAVIQETFPGPWMNIGVDAMKEAMTPERYQPGIGLRPGEADHPVAPLVPVFYAALYESIAAHSRLGLNVVADTGHHDPGILADCARRLAGLPALFVGVRCPLEVIMERRRATWGAGAGAPGSPDDPVPAPVLAWQREVHVPGIYDLEVDTSLLTPEKCAAAIARRLSDGPPPSAFRQLGEVRS